MFLIDSFSLFFIAFTLIVKRLSGLKGQQICVGVKSGLHRCCAGATDSWSQAGGAGVWEGPGAGPRRWEEQEAEGR